VTAQTAVIGGVHLDSIDQPGPLDVKRHRCRFRRPVLESVEEVSVVLNVEVVSHQRCRGFFEVELDVVLA
jgi:hypothetical protein